MNKILVLDNYDSFTYNLVHFIEKITGTLPVVKRNDEIEISDISYYDTIFLSPGPGLPYQAGILKECIKTYAGRKNIFGVCLGMQAIGEVFGARLKNLDNVFHGVSTDIKILVPEDKLFTDIPESFIGGRYHSWVIEKNTLPKELIIICEDKTGEIMGIHHESYNLFGVQFHPESILTPLGEKIIENFLKSC
ncbi:anthranilate synthase component II [Bacteroidota bacterium]